MLFFLAMNIAVFLKEGTGRLLLLENGKLTTAEEIKQMMISNLALPEEADKVFAIWLISPLLGKTKLYLFIKATSSIPSSINCLNIFVTFHICHHLLFILYSLAFSFHTIFINIFISYGIY